MSEKRVLAGTYEIIGYLQSGSGGDVYKAYHRRLKKEVILKKIRHKGVSMNINRQEVDILKICGIHICRRCWISLWKMANIIP